MPETLTQRTIRNSVYSLASFVFPLLISFVATPIIVRSLGSAKFGFYSLLNSVTLVLGLLDFGLSYTFTKHLSENRMDQSDPALSVSFSSTEIIYAILGMLGFLLLLLLQGLFRFFFKTPEGYISSLSLAFFIMGATYFIKMLSVPLIQIPYSLQRQDVITNILVISNAILLLGSVFALKTGHGILSLLVVQLISIVFTLFGFYFAWRKLAPNLKFIPSLSKKVARTIGQEGFWIFIRNNMGNILAYLDKFVLGAMWGTTAVGYYSAAQMIPEKISSTSLSFSQLFFPIFSEVHAQEGEGSQRVKAIFRRSFGILSIISAGLTIVVLLYGYQLIHYWISKDFADHTALAIPLLAVTFFLLSLGNFLQSFLSGLKELKFLGLSVLIIAMVDVVFMFMLIPKFSVDGASLAYMLSGLPILAFLYYIERKYFNSATWDITAFYGKLFGRVLLVGGLIYILSLLFVRPFMTNLALAVVLGGVTFLLYLGLFWLLGFFSPEDMALAKNYFARFTRFFRRKSQDSGL